MAADRHKRVTTAIRFDPDLHEVLRETADELTVGVNWLVNQLCREGLSRMDLTEFRLTRKGHEKVHEHVR